MWAAGTVIATLLKGVMFVECASESEYIREYNKVGVISLQNAVIYELIRLQIFGSPLIDEDRAIDALKTSEKVSVQTATVIAGAIGDVNLPPSFIDLLCKILVYNPAERLTAIEVKMCFIITSFVL